MTVELQFSYITAGIRRSHITYIAEPARTIYICIRHFPDGTLLVNDIQWQGIHEVFTIGALENSQQHTLRTIRIVTRRPPYLGNHMRLTQIQPCPRIATLPRSEESVKTPVEGIRTGIDSRRLLIGGIVYRIRGTNHRSRQFPVVGHCLKRRQEQQRHHCNIFHCFHICLQN